MEQQFWVVGGDRIHVQIQGKIHVFGKQLDSREAEQLANAFNARLKKLKGKSESPQDSLQKPINRSEVALNSKS